MYETTDSQQINKMSPVISNSWTRRGATWRNKYAKEQRDLINGVVKPVRGLQWQRGILVRWEYHAQNFLGFVQLACLVILFRRF
jgi:hypothetical protein